jgi:hypothetical protein
MSLDFDIRVGADAQQHVPMLGRPDFRQAVAKHGTDTVGAGGDEDRFLMEALGIEACSRFHEAGDLLGEV